MQGKAGDELSVLIDAHVHLHDCYAPATFLTSAHDNFERARQRHGWSPGVGVLMLTECEGVDWFGRLAGRANSAGAAPTSSSAPGPSRRLPIPLPSWRKTERAGS